MGKLMPIVGCALAAAAVGCMVLAFASPYWVERFDQFTQGRFVKLGLWEVCFNDYTFWKDYNGKRYLGCWYIFSPEIRPIWEWISPPWFISVQVMISLSLLVQVLNTICLILYVFGLFPKYLRSVLLASMSGVMLFTAVLIFISLVVFGVKKEDRNWVPRPDMNFLSWSYGLACMSMIFALGSAAVLFSASRSEDKDYRY